MNLETLRWEGDLPGSVSMLDQTLLPGQEQRIRITDAEEMIEAIKRLAVRGAPAIGIAGAYGVVLEAQGAANGSAAELLGTVRDAVRRLDAARPTAVNLSWATARMLRHLEVEAARDDDPSRLLAVLLAEARAIHDEDAARCRRMGELGSELLKDGMRIMTHCNAGSLATGGIGTALAPIYVATENGLALSVFANETRPLLQGARITSFELARAGIDVTLLVDSAAGGILARGEVDCILVGADRIAANGDVCNKVGTYPLAVLADRHGVPFYVVAPSSTFDLGLQSGAEIPIEERSEEEVTSPLGQRAAPAGLRARNPAFDITPAELVRAIVTEAGIIHAPSTESVSRCLSGQVGTSAS